MAPRGQDCLHRVGPASIFDTNSGTKSRHGSDALRGPLRYQNYNLKDSSQEEKRRTPWLADTLNSFGLPSRQREIGPSPPAGSFPTSSTARTTRRRRNFGKSTALRAGPLRQNPA